MMKKKPLLSMCLAVCLALVLFYPASLACAPDAFGSQTIMIYIIGADLESDAGMATSDIKEMLKAKPDPQRLNVLVMSGGSKAWKSRVIPTDKLSVFKIEGANPQLIHQWESGSMGESAALSRFLEFGVSQYPADSYGLILWDHGGGPLLGFGMDTLYKNDALSLPELQQALTDSPFHEEEQLEWIAFDACLMASLEIAATLSPYAHYMIASQETLPGRGFDYTFLKNLSKTGLSGPEVAQEMIDSTFLFYEEFTAKNPEVRSPVTLSLTDLGKIAPLQQRLGQIFDSLSASLESERYSDVARYRNKTKDYGRTTTTNDYDLIDLSDFADSLSLLYPQEAESLKTLLGEAVLYNRATEPRTNGLSLYFPLRNKQMFRQEWAGLYRQLDISPAYRSFIDQFGSILLSDSLSNWKGDDAPAIAQDTLTGEYYILLTPDQVKSFEKAEYYVLAQLKGEEFLLYYMSSDVTLDAQNRLFANFNGKTVYMEDWAGSRSILPYLSEKENIEGVASYQIPVVLTKTEEEEGFISVNAQLLVQLDKEKEIAQVTGLIKDEDAAFLLGKRDLDLSSFQSMYFVYNSAYLTRDEGGDILPFGDWVWADTPRVINLPIQGGIRARYENIPLDQYDFYVLMSIIDTQGNVSSSQLMPLEKPTENSEDSSVGQSSEAAKITYSRDTKQPVLLTEEHGLRISLADIRPPSEEQAADGSSPLMTLDLLVENDLLQDQLLEVDWLMMGGMMVEVPSYGTIPAMGSALVPVGIPARVSSFGPAINLDVSAKSQDIRLRFSFPQYQGDMFSVPVSREIQIQTDLSWLKTEAEEEPQPAPSALLLEEEGVRIELTEDPYIKDSELYVPLKISNDSPVYNRVSLAESAVNGLMAPMQMQDRVLPGAVLYTQARIQQHRTLLPEEMAQYQYMFDGYDNLETLGISEVLDITLRFHLQGDRESSGEKGRSLSHLTSTVEIHMPNPASLEQTLDTEGETVFAFESIKIIRLASDLGGKKFYISNGSPYPIHIATFGHVEADGQAYALNTPLYADVASGKSAYTKLFGFLPGYEPQARELSFYISIIDLEHNKLITRSDKITLALP